MTTSQRAADLAAALGRVEARIDAACRSAGRERSGVRLVAVTKFFPAEDAAALARLGVLDLAESRDQEAATKVEQMRALGVECVRWHFVGQLQTNKAAHVARYADVVHSVDRDRLARALGRAAASSGRLLDALVQVRLDTDPQSPRGGVPPEGVDALADVVASAEGLRLAGVMGVAPRGHDPAPAFERLADIAHRLRRDHPEASTLSAGMSTDLEAAVAAGATHLRIGSAILGARPGAGYRG